MEIDEMYVRPAFRKRGVGKKLMDDALRISRKLKCRRIFIESAYKHKAAHKFYTKLGFKNYGYRFIKDL